MFIISVEAYLNIYSSKTNICIINFIHILYITLIYKYFSLKHTLSQHI